MLSGEAKEKRAAISADDAMVEARDLEKTYATGGATVHALRGVDEFDGGGIFVAGEFIAKMSDRKRTRFRAERMGFIFQTYNLIPVLSAVENVELPLLVAGAKPKEARRRAMSVLEMVGVPEQANKRPNQMSGGQQQRVTVARSLVNDPAIVWADEPTGALDSETSAEIVELLVRLNREQGQTFVLVTHDAAVAARAHRTIRMRDGMIETNKPNGGPSGKEV